MPGFDMPDHATVLCVCLWPCFPDLPPLSRYFHYMLAAVAEQALHEDGEGDASVTDKDPVLVARYQALQVNLLKAVLPMPYAIA
jgi:N-acetyl-beta-hexosaminidase